MRRFVNVGNAVRDFLKSHPEAVAAIPSIGYKIQMAQAGLVHTMTPEDIETLYQLAARLAATAGVSSPILAKWRSVDVPPDSGGPYLVGGYIEDNLGRRFTWTNGHLFRLVTGPEWKHSRGANTAVPIEYWMEIPPHPERGE